MLLTQYLHIALLVLLLGAQHSGRSFWVFVERWMAPFFVISTTGVLLYYTHAQFLAWSNGGNPVNFLVPPYQGMGYFLFYVSARFWGTYLLSGAIALVIYLVARKANMIYDERFFYKNELVIIALCIFAVGHPLWIAYLAGTVAVYFLFHVFRRLFTRKAERLSFYYFWLPVAIAFIALTPLLQKSFLFLSLKI